MQLRTLLGEAGWTGQDLARAVNEAGAEAGLTLHYDRTSVAHWLAGTRPPARVRPLVAEAFSRTLHRHITVADTALARRSAPAPPDTAAQLVELAQAGPGAPGAAVYTLAAEECVPVPGTPAPQPPGGDRVEAAQVQAAESLLGLFVATADMFGGGYPRRALAQHLAVVVAPWLRADAGPRIRHQLLGCAARLSYVAGFTHFDENLNGAAQAYYRAAGRLGTEAADPSCCAPPLRAMSVQAHHLGHRTQALHLAEAAGQYLPAIPVLQQAFVTGQLAVAAAGCSDRRRALSQLNRAQQLLDRADGGDTVIGSYHLAALTHQEAEVLTALGDRSGAVRALTASLRHRPEGERHARAITSARLAELHLGQRHIEAACTTWHAFLDDYPQLHSARADAALRRMRARLAPYRKTATVRALLERAVSVKSAAPRGR